MSVIASELYQHFNIALKSLMAESGQGDSGFGKRLLGFLGEYQLNEIVHLLQESQRGPVVIQSLDNLDFSGSEEAFKALILDQNITCAICTAPMDGSDSLALPCRHEYDSVCIRQWAESKVKGMDQGNGRHVKSPPNCPLCRMEFQAGAYWADLAHTDAITTQSLAERTYIADDDVPWESAFEGGSSDARWPALVHAATAARDAPEGQVEHCFKNALRACGWSEQSVHVQTIEIEDIWPYVEADRHNSRRMCEILKAVISAIQYFESH
ncbi:RING finger domain-containing protein [Streptomyces sp. NPDC048270]|uniref:RING finger domain-containing protein n=1 Tax=Streptomyces sp. NPDC048270 TaxID=3154615 RepID=UPI0033C34906